MRSRALCVLAVAIVCLATAVPVQAGYVSAVLADSPFDYYRMQETNVGHGTAAANSGTAGIAGTYQKAAGSYGSIDDVPGMTSEVGIGKEFIPAASGMGGSISSATSGTSHSSAFTLEFLLDPASYSDHPGINPIYSSDYPYTGSVHLLLNGSSLGLGMGGNSATPSVDIASAAPAGHWAHVAVTYEVKDDDSYTKFYVNGTLLNLGGSPGGGRNAAYFDNFSGSIGHHAVGDTHYWFTGGLDEFAIYGTALSDSTIAYHASLVAPEPSTVVLLSIGLVGLLAYAWRKRK